MLPRENIVAPLQARTLSDALVELVDRLADEGRIRDRDAIDRLLASAAGRDMVAAGAHVVMPHHRTDAVDELHVALGVAADGLDGRTVGLRTRPRILVLILAPTGAATLYLQTVAALARLLHEPVVVDRIAAARSVDEVLEVADLSALRLQPRLAVRDVMVHGAISVTPSTSVQQAVDLMVRHRIRALPVVGEKQEVLGIVSEWDLMRGLLPQIPRAGQDGGVTAIPEAMRIKDIMSRSVLCISEDLGLEEAANMMINKDVEQFPVTREGKLTGFLTRGDIIRKLFGR